MEFSIPFPFPNFGNGIFYSRSRSRTLKSHSRSPLMEVDKVADMDFSMIFLYFMVKYFGVTRLERPKAVKDDVKQARRA